MTSNPSPEIKLFKTFVKTKPYTYQYEGLKKIIDLVNNGVKYYALFIDMGLGKTKLSIDIANYLFLNNKIDAVLVVAPSGVDDQWSDEQIPKHTGLPAVSLVWGNKRTKKQLAKIDKITNDKFPGRLKWFLVHYDKFSRLAEDQSTLLYSFLLKNRCFLILDEASSVKNIESNRTKQLGMIAKACPYRAILSGNVITNSPFDLYSMFDILCPGFWGMNYFMFTHTYGVMIQGYNGNRKFDRIIGKKDKEKIWDELDLNGKSYFEVALQFGMTVDNVRYIDQNRESESSYKNIEILKQKIFDCSIIVRKEDCYDLPDKVYQTLKVEMSPEQKTIYKNMVEELVSEYRGKEISAPIKLALYIKLQQITSGIFPSKKIVGDKIMDDSIPIGSSSEKINAVVRDINELGGDKFLIWCNFKYEVQLCMEQLRKTYPEKRIERYDGSISKEIRNAIRSDHTKGLIDGLILNQSVGARGLNLDQACYAYFLSNNADIDTRLQAEDRIHRTTQKRTCFYKDIICTGTYDEQVIENLKNKKNVLDEFNVTNLKF